MRAVVTIPARYASTRFPGKVLAPLLSRPMLAWVVEAGLRAKTIESVWVATEDPRIADAAREAGAQVVMTSPDCATGTDRVAAAAASVDADIYVNLQADEPLVDPADIERLVAALAQDRQIAMATLARPLSDASEFSDPNAVKVVCSARGDALYFSRAAIPFGVADAVGEAAVAAVGGPLRHLGVYAFSRDALAAFPRLPRGRLERLENLEQLRALEQGWRIRVLLTQARGLGVDTPEELRAVEDILRSGLPSAQVG